MLCALGLDDQLVGITHECDFPSSVKGKPVVVRSDVPVEAMTQPDSPAKRHDCGYAITPEIIAFVACLCGYHASCSQAPQESLRLDLSS